MKADEMFKELGYKYTEVEEPETEGFNSELRYIVFFKTIKDDFELGEIEIVIWFDIGFKNFYKQTKTGEITQAITMQELKAINKKCEELGWIE